MQQEDRFRSFLECAPDAIIITNAEGEIVFYNNQAEKLFLFSAEEVAGRNVESLIPDWRRPVHITGNGKLHSPSAACDEGCEEIFLRGQRKNGGKFQAAIRLSLIKTASGEVYNFATVRDTIQKDGVEHRLRGTQGMFERIFESSLYGIIQFENVRNADGEVCDFRYLLVNKRGEELIQSSKERVTGNTLLEINKDLKGSELFKAMKAAVDNGDIEKRELMLDRKGRKTWYKMNFINIDDGLLVTFDDITQRKEAERKLKELNQDLEKRVGERTRDLSAANARLRDINEKLDRYAYMISHDLKAPLSNIEGIAMMLEDDYADQPLDEEGREMLGMMKAKVCDMKNIIVNVLQSAKDEIKSKGEVNLFTAAQEVIETLDPPSHFHIFVQHSLPVVRYPRTSVIQIFQNLLSNSIKYMDKEFPLITISCAEDHDCYLVCVSDNGPGIPEEKLREVFNLFEVAHNGTREVESHGIGLTIVKQLVEENGGKIWAESKPGRETKFHFTIPKKQGQ